MSTSTHTKVDANAGFAVLVLLTIFLPKINILKVAGSGIRLEDVIMLLYALWLVGYFSIRGLICRERLVTNLFFLSFLIALVGVLIVVFRFNGQNLHGILFAVRPLEYSLYVFAGYFSAKRVCVIKIIYWYVWLNAIVVFLQKTNLIGGFARGNYDATVSGRPFGLTSGPWEVALIFSFGIVFLISLRIRKRSQFFSTLTICILIASLMFTQSRIGVASVVIVTLIVTVSLCRVRVSSLFFIFFLILISFFTMTYGFERMETLYSMQNLDFIVSAFDNVNIDNYRMNSREVSNYGEYVVDQVDLSLAERILKWVYVIKSVFLSPLALAVGYGPGAFGVAVDGAYIRVIGELGVLGIVLYLLLFRKIISLSIEVRIYVLLVLINGLFIDVFYASRIMSIMYLLSGAAIFQRWRNIETVNLLQSRLNYN